MSDSKDVVSRPVYKPRVCHKCAGWPAVRRDGLMRPWCEDCWYAEQEKVGG